MIGARDMAFPRLNRRLLDNSASWFVLIGSLLIDAPDAGWTSYLPSTTTGQVGQSAWISYCCLARPRFWARRFSRHDLRCEPRDERAPNALVLLVNVCDFCTGTDYDAGTRRSAD